MPQPPKAFVATLAVQYGQRLRRFLSRHTANASDVPDLAQEVFMRLMRVHDHTEIRSPEAYLFTIASHVVQQHSQKQAALPEPLPITEVFTELELLAEEDPQDRAATEQQLETLERALDELPVPVAMALLLHRFKGLTIAEIARDLGLAQITVKKYLARALLHCRDHCAPREGRDAP